MGTTYANRAEAMRAGVHQVGVQGISGNGKVGANSVVVSGGYEDDQDFGSEIIYTGAGGNRGGRQVAHQELSYSDNAALVVSEERAYPVRVIRGSKGDKTQAPSSGYRYDGLFRITRHWAETGKSGFRIWRFRLVKLSLAEAAPYVPDVNLPRGTPTPPRSSGIVQRIVRSTAVSDAVKRIHDYTCQVCDESLLLPVGDYAEGAHIRGLGRPHEGPDQPGNLLCLCPNHHVLFDKGAIYVDESFDVRNFEGRLIGPLTLKPGHVIDTAQLKYHRESSGQPDS